MSDFFDDPLLPVFPVERPGWTVAIHLACAILVTQHIVAHHRENGCNKNEEINSILMIQLSNTEIMHVREWEMLEIVWKCSRLH